MEGHPAQHPHRKVFLYTGAAVFALAFAMLILPAVTSIAIEVLVGILVLLAGLVRIYWAFHATQFKNGAYLFVLGLVTVIAGIAMLSHPSFAGGSLTMIVTVYLLIDGIVEVVVSRLIQPKQGWQWLQAAGVISVLLGILTWIQAPLAGAWAIGFYLALKLMLIAVIILRSRVGAH